MECRRWLISYGVLYSHDSMGHVPNGSSSNLNGCGIDLDDTDRLHVYR